MEKGRFADVEVGSNSTRVIPDYTIFLALVKLVYNKKE